MPENANNLLGQHADARSSLELVRLVARLVCFLPSYGEGHPQSRQVLAEMRKALEVGSRARATIAFVLHGGSLLVEGHYQPPADVYVMTLVSILLSHGVNSFTFETGITEEELIRFAGILSAKPQDVVANGILKPEAVRGLERIRINGVRYWAVRDGRGVAAGDTAQAAPLAAAVKGSAPEPFAPAGGAARTRSEARMMAFDSLAARLLSDGESVPGPPTPLPEGLRAGPPSPGGQAGLPDAAAESTVDDEALHAAFSAMAVQAGGVLPLLESIGRLAPRTGHGTTLHALGRLMKFLPEVDKLEDMLRGQVLVVDGSTARREAYREALAGYGYTVEAVASGVEALSRAAAKTDYAAVVTNLLLPDMACGVLLARLRRARSSTPVVVTSVTAEAAEADFEVLSYPRKRIVVSHDAGMVAEAVRAIAVPPDRPEADVDRADRERAREIQERLVPRDLPAVPGWEMAFAYRPVKEVGGDYLDVFPLDGDRIGFVVGDVSGKGFSAAMVMVMVRSAFRMSAPGCPTPRETAIAVNRLVRADIKRGMFVSIVYGCLHVPSGRIVVVNCGHNPPVLVDAPDGKPRLLSSGGLPIGVAAPERFDPLLCEEEVTLAPGGRILFYTDGVVEAMNLNEMEFGEESLLEHVARVSLGPSRNVVDTVLARLAAHRGAAAQSDDITLLDLRRLPA
jgi:serine phosphatase RsbU (regulator of sigma subunit)